MTAIQRRRAERGLTMIEAMIGVFLFTLLFLGAWTWYDTNRKVLDRGKDKLSLQQAQTQAVEAMSRAIRAGSSVVLSGGNDLTIYDRAGNVVSRFFRDGTSKKLSTAAGAAVIPEECTAITFTIPAIDPPDTTEIRFSLTIKDRWENSATVRGSAHLRNG